MTHVPTRAPMQRQRRPLRRAAVLLAALLLVLTGCASIPRSGPVGTSQAENSVSHSNPFAFIPQGPVPGASQQAIIEGFLGAGTGSQDDYAVARQFLAPGFAGTWKPDERTLVYRDNAKITNNGSSESFRVDVNLAQSIDGDGVATQAAPGAVESVAIKLVQVDGQWRISSVPDGILVSLSNFSTLFSSYTLYYYDPSYLYLVPDIRFFVNRPTVAFSLVRALMDGPAPYLKGAVVSAFPAGIKLARDSVPVVSGVASVDLSSQDILDSSIRDRQRMQTQLLSTLQNLSSISAVTLRADQRDVDLGNRDDSVPQPVRNRPVAGSQVGILHNELVRYENTQTTRLEGVPSVAAYSPRGPAMSYSQRLFAFLTGDRSQLMTVVPGHQVKVAATGPKLTAPSISPQDWVWTAAADGSGKVLAVQPRGAADNQQSPAVAITAQWLVGRTVKDLRISRDGARALVISDRNGVTAIQISGVVQGSDGTPKDLTPPLTLSTTVAADSGVWVDETSVAVIKGSGTAMVVPQILGLNGNTTQVGGLQGMLSISAGNGAQDLYGQTASGLSIRVGNGWAEQAKDIKDPAFAG
ncbi:GerMN domain-containing protein [Paenarthrobacter sp. DKR-5]|uniref:LpqB family beta-propeller domain-containing protein n=1 Tax=Paenarthrobacter sp. DKR-5 TaxID=2835535 RepID=UPI001BDBB508|nr:LpqB family beta-propeller domain-containing protein [Paenarthrobacter sp. DKR-5]MBT1003002.1 GerMN domain-containing protein [Paenarthrobacter sp. DKR-5]